MYPFVFNNKKKLKKKEEDGITMAKSFWGVRRKIDPPPVTRFVT